MQIVRYLYGNKVRIVPEILVNAGGGRGEDGMLSAVMGKESFKKIRVEKPK